VKNEKRDVKLEERKERKKVACLVNV